MGSSETNHFHVIEAICDQLEERTATLFLGAGINAGIVNDAAEEFPLGRNLSRWIARDLLGEPQLDSSLEDVAEMARYRLGEEAVNQYIYDKFATFSPGTAHLAVVQLPWDVIYTTNYDMLLEEASRLSSIKPAGVIRSVLGINDAGDDLTTFTDRDIPYYKLHGSIDFPNTSYGRFVLTKDDYRFYDRYRKPLFRRLARDLTSRTFVFVGYSLSDDNFRAILDDCRDQLRVSVLPRSYAVQKSFTPVQEVFWLEKYNIQLVADDASTFMELLKDTWLSQSRTTASYEERQSREYVEADRSTHFPRVAESFYRVRPAECNGPSEPRLFFQGGEASWADTRDHIPAQRDVYWPLSEAIFPELAEPDSAPGVYLVTGAAGTGKTALIRTLAFDLAKEFDLPMLVYIPGTPLDARLLGTLVNPHDKRRIIVIFHHAADNLRAIQRFIEDAKQYSLPLTVILEERKNQWNSARAC